MSDAGRKAHALDLLIRLEETGGLSAFELGVVAHQVIRNVKSRYPAARGLEGALARVDMSPFERRSVAALLERAAPHDPAAARGQDEGKEGKADADGSGGGGGGDGGADVAAVDDVVHGGPAVGAARG